MTCPHQTDNYLIAVALESDDDPFGIKQIKKERDIQRFRKELRDRMREESQRLLREKYGD